MVEHFIEHAKELTGNWHYGSFVLSLSEENIFKIVYFLRISLYYLSNQFLKNTYIFKITKVRKVTKVFLFDKKKKNQTFHVQNFLGKKYPRKCIETWPRFFFF